MAYTLDVGLALGAGNTGLSLEMQLKNTSGVNVGAAVTTGFVEFGATGNYLFHYAAWPDGHRGAAVFQVAGGGAVKAAVAINPEEAENTDVKTSSIASAAGIAAAVWAYATRTLTMTAAQIVAILSGSTLTLERGDTWTIPITGLGSLVGATKIWFTLKSQHNHTDAQSLVQVELSGGLLYLNGAAAVTASDGSLVVDDVNAGNITITGKPAATAVLSPATRLYWDVQTLTAGVVSTRTSGAANISGDVTRAIS